MNSGLYSVLYLMYFIIIDSVLYFADIECGFSHGKTTQFIFFLLKASLIEVLMNGEGIGIVNW